MRRTTSDLALMLEKRRGNPPSRLQKTAEQSSKVEQNSKDPSANLNQKAVSPTQEEVRAAIAALQSGRKAHPAHVPVISIEKHNAIVASVYKDKEAEVLSKFEKAFGQPAYAPLGKGRNRRG
jgi:hypothetical protein